MPKFGVSPEKEKELLQRMRACEIHEGDLEEQFISSGGPGGQKVNRTATCVRLKHVPTGLEVKMQKARSQALNRFYARRRLCELVEQRDPGRSSPVDEKREKIRRQKARRSRRSRTKYSEDSD
ncbi:MAG: peptide chain release factor-like protein [Candidatus Hydrogenedentes bacterium]|nr:peptide chain release factor-like protein [Candidatus Hydrogenedentota bacterium]